MTRKEPKLRDAEHALTAALVAGLAEPGRNRLIEAHFGQYSAVDEGWWFTLQFLSEVGSHSSPQEEGQGPRIDKIIRAWSKDVGRYRKAGQESEPAGA
jgi:hypothetical protein